MSGNYSRGDLVVAISLFLGALAFLFSFEPLSRPATLDPATWDMMSLGLLEGRLPYRDVFLHKTPGGALLGAAGARLLPTLPGLGLTPLEGAHCLFVILGAAGPAMLFLLCRRQHPLAVALSAALLMLAFDQWPAASIEGVRPKVATTVLGLASLLAAAGGRSCLSGLAAGASVLCWQPGLCFLAGAGWELRRQGGHRTRLLAFATASAVLPAALVLWLALSGALAQFIDQALVFNLSYIDWHARSPLGTARQLLRLAGAWNPAELALAPLATAGLLAGRRGRGVGGLATAGLVYLAMSFLSLQAWPDTILFAPFVGAGLGLGLGLIVSSAARRFAQTPSANSAALVALVLLAAALAVNPKAQRMRTPVSFQDQARFIAGLEADLSDKDRVLVLGFPEFSIHTGRASVWPWPYMWFGVDRFVAERSDGGFQGMLDRLEQSDPKLMVVARRWSGPLRRRFHEWALTRYGLEERFFYPHTKRPLRIYRRR